MLIGQDNAMSELYLVTGAAGFIGSNIIRRLVQERKRVRAIDNFSTGKRENIEPILSSIDFTEADVRDLTLMRRLTEGVDYVLHQAAIPSVPRSIADPLATNDANVTGALSVLVASRDSGVKRVVYASSSSVYGDTPTLPKNEDMPTKPLSPYAVAKYAGELYHQVFYRVYGLETVCLRYFNVFGPWQDPNSQYSAAIPKFVIALLSGKSPTIYGDGTQTRDFTFVENVVEANLLACQAKGAAGQVFNIGCGRSTSINILAQILADIVGTKVEPQYVEPRRGDVTHSLADIGKARETLGYHAEISVEEGLHSTVEWYRGCRRRPDA